MTDQKTNGLYQKYTVERLADPRGRHDECEYFVLDLTHDPLARHAAEQYAYLASKHGYKTLATELLAKVEAARENA